MPENKKVLVTPLKSEVTSKNGKCCLQYQGAACAPDILHQRNAQPDRQGDRDYETYPIQVAYKIYKGAFETSRCKWIGDCTFLMPGVLGTACCRIFG